MQRRLSSFESQSTLRTRLFGERETMSDPKRWLASESGAPGALRELLRAAQPTRPMSTIDRSRAAVTVAKIASKPALFIVSATWLKLAAVMVGVSVSTAIGVAAHVNHGSASRPANTPVGQTRAVDLPIETTAPVRIVAAVPAVLHGDASPRAYPLLSQT